MREPINRRRLEQIDERDREVRETARGLALAKRTTFPRYELPKPDEFFLELIKDMRLGGQS